MSTNVLTWESATKLKVPDEEFFIWAYVENINYFLKDDLEEFEAADAKTKTAKKRKHVRRRYKGDPAAYDVEGHDYDYLFDPGRRVSNALPGWSFTLYDGIQRRTFTTNATVYQLHGWLEKALDKKVRLYTQGAAHPVDFTPSEGG